MSLRMSNVNDECRNYYVLKIKEKEKEKDINKARGIEKDLYNPVIDLAKEKGIERKWSNPEFKKMYCDKIKEKLQTTNALNQCTEPYKRVIKGWIQKYKLCSSDKRDLLVWDILGCMDRSNINPTDFENIINITENNDIIIQEGNLWINLKKYFPISKHIDFLKCISDTCPRSLQTSPNSDCGKFELFYRLIRPNSKQPKKGDIIDEGKCIDIKGKEIRIWHQHMKGTEYYKLIIDTFKEYILPSKILKGGMVGKDSYEIEKPSHEKHFTNEFSKKSYEQNINIMKKYLDGLEINGDTHELAKKIFIDNRFNRDGMVDIILYDFMSKIDCKWIIFGNGNNVKILDKVDDLKKFNKKGDYFRINQNNTIGWYIE